MWLAKRDSSRKRENATKMIYAKQDAQGIIGESEHREVPLCMPYGIYAKLPQTTQTLVLSASGTEVCMGVIQENPPQLKDLQDGELLLCSEGGASIRLCNDGKVLINGKIIA